MIASSTAAVASPPGAAAAPAEPDDGTFLDWIADMEPQTPQGVALIEGARKLRDEIAAGDFPKNAETTPDIYRGEP